MVSVLEATIDRYDRITSTLENAAIGRLNAAFLASYEDMERSLQRIYSQLQGEGALVKTKRYLLLMEQVREILNAISPAQATELQAQLEAIYQQAAQNGLDLSGNLINIIAPDDFARTTAVLPVESAAFAARDSMQRLSRYSDEFREKATAIVTQGLIQGLGTRQVASAIRNQLGVTRSKAETIARTEILSANNDAAKFNYQNNGIAYGQVISTADDRTCKLCSARNMQVYRLDQIRVPFHPRCRCYLMPFSPDWLKLGLVDEKWMKDFQKEVQDQVIGDLDNGPGAFEKYEGLTKAPQPVWTPQSGWTEKIPKVRKARTRKPKATPELQPDQPTPEPTPESIFPETIAGLKKVKDLGGSTGAELVEDAKGNRFVLKRGADAGHLREEFAADRFYEALGVPVPPGKLYEEKNGPVKLTQFIEGKALADLKGSERKAAIEQLQKGFAADALLGNWDVIGLSSDNVLVGADGTAYRIDNGGSLRYRAQGALKGKAWDGYPSELWSMRDSKISQSAAEVFDGLNFKSIKGQIQALDFKKAIETIADKGQREILEKRLSEMERVARIAQVFEDDAWNDEYIDRFAKHSMGLRKAGIVDRMPRLMKKSRPVYILKDENGKEFDSFRGRDSITNDLIDYIDRSGGNYYWAESYLTGQSGHSWNDEPQAYKYFLSSQRAVSQENGYFWADGIDKPKSLYNAISDKAQYDETMTAYHAFTYEVFTNIELPNVDRTTQSATLIRTERKYVVQGLNGMKVGDTKVILKGPAESTSLVKVTVVEGAEVTTQVVPIHRLVASYLPSRFRDSDSDALLGDNENEVLAMMEGIPTYYKQAGKSSY